MEPKAPDTQQLHIPLDPPTIQILKNLIAQFAPSLPAGTIAGFGSDTPPSGWLLCDGRAVSRTTYAALFATIGTGFGAGDGSTTFNLPDGRTQVMAGKKSGDPNFGAFGNIAGAEVSHVLTINEMPAHTHGVHTNHAGTFITASGYQTGDPNQGDVDHATASTGGGVAHNNIQPTFVANYIIKT